MKIKRLGNGGAFDFDATNSSFLITTVEDKDYLLFDCGYSVYSKLRQEHLQGNIDITKLKYVYISHMDDDHMGSLKTLIYYMYFIHHIYLRIIACKEVYNDLMTYLSDIDGIVENDIKIKHNLFMSIELDEYLNLNDIVIFPIGTHHYKPCYGLAMRYDDKVVVITGDTKGCSEVFDSISNSRCIAAFHDYSNWDCLSQQVHACKTDFDRYVKHIYPNTVNKIIKYHNNEPFIEDWVPYDKLIEIHIPEVLY